MKACVITYHKVYNYGSSLQAYATKKTLEKLGLEVEIINYVPRRYRNAGSFMQVYREKKYFISNPVKRLISTFLSMSTAHIQIPRFNRFDEVLQLGKEIDEHELFENPVSADIYFTGSDQVWNNHFDGFEKAFFLDFVKDGSPCFAYSASFGKAEFSNDECEELKFLLKKYSAISLREDSGKRLVESLGISCCQTLDPVYGLTSEDWKAIMIKPEFNEDYILVYKLNASSNLTDYAKTLSKEYGGMKIVMIEFARKQRERGITYVSLPTVNEYLGLFYNAKYVVTDSFHGTSFSICFKKPFFVALPPMFSSRIESVLGVFELESRIVHTQEDMKILSRKSIKWDVVNQRLQSERARNINFLNECVLLAKSKRIGG